MKKILSLALVVTILLSTLLLASCDISNLLSNFVPQATTPDETTPAEPVRNTITKDEWIANMNSSNFTYVQKHTSQENTVIAIAQITETTGEVKRSDLNENFYWALLDGKVYQIEKDEKTGKWIASFEDREWFTLGDQLGVPEDYFELNLQYNEESKSYIDQTETVFVEFYFENGKLVKASVENTEFSLSIIVENVGTTTATLPDYTMPENK